MIDSKACGNTKQSLMGCEEQEFFPNLFLITFFSHIIIIRLARLHAANYMMDMKKLLYIKFQLIFNLFFSFSGKREKIHFKLRINS